MNFLEIIKGMSLKAFLDVLTALATVVATTLAWRTAAANKKQAKDQIDEQHRVERPRIIPLNRDMFLTNERPSPSWTVDNGESLPDNSYRVRELSDFTFKLINAGKSFAIKIDLTFELVNGINSVREFNTDENKYRYSLKINQPELQDRNPSVFSFKTFQDKNNPEQYKPSNYIVDPFVQRIPLLTSNDSYSVQIPNYFVELSNIQMFILKTEMPELKLTIQYIDQYHTQHTDTYKMKVKYKPIAFSKEKEYFVDFENLDSK